MSKAIAMIWGAWIMYCAMIGSYDGAIALLAIYVFTPIKIDWHDLFTIKFDNKKRHDRRKQSCPEVKVFSR